ncbi:MAG: AAA family ATPase [Polyangiaceae bacterium]
MGSVHLICGPLGAGKTTYAHALAKRVQGLCLSTDQWLVTLFHPDRPPSHGFEWALDRMLRIEAQMWHVAEPLIARGVPVLFDSGLPRREDRERWRWRALELGGTPKLHYLDVDVDIRRSRVRMRNEERGPAFAFAISDAMFDHMEGRFEPPTEDELYDAMIVG